MGIKEAALLMTGHDKTPDVFAGAVDAYRLMLGYLGWFDAGTVLAPGVGAAGEIAGTPFVDQTEQLGRSL